MKDYWFQILHQYRSVIPSDTQVKEKKLEWVSKQVNMSKSNLDEIIEKIKTNYCSDNPLSFKDRKKFIVKIELATPFKSKAHHIGMSPSLRKECHEEIKDLLHKRFIKESSR